MAIVFRMLVNRYACESAILRLRNAINTNMGDHEFSFSPPPMAASARSIWPPNGKDTNKTCAAAAAAETPTQIKARNGGGAIAAAAAAGAATTRHAGPAERCSFYYFFG